MVAIVFAFSLSLFDVFELGVPKAVGNMASGPPREGLVDAFFKGVLATLLATPCSGPLLGSTLTWALAQPPYVVYTVFLSLGIGMAFPYVVLTANPKLLKFLPKPGAWMATFKQAMGFVLLLTVIYLMTLVEREQVLFVVAFLVFVAFGCWWWGRFATFDQALHKRFATLAAAGLIVWFGFFFSFGWFKDFVDDESEVWIALDFDLLDEALAGGTNVLIDFTADWCPNCKLNEAVVYESEQCHQLIESKGIVPFIADITHDNPRTDAIEELMDEYGASAIPFFLVFSGDDPENPHRLYDIVTKGELFPILEALPETDSAEVLARLGTR